MQAHVPMHILLYITMTQLQSIVTAVHEYGIYETITTKPVDIITTQFLGHKQKVE